MIDIKQTPQYKTLVIDNGWQYLPNTYVPTGVRARWEHVFTNGDIYIYSDNIDCMWKMRTLSNEYDDMENDSLDKIIQHLRDANLLKPEPVTIQNLPLEQISYPPEGWGKEDVISKPAHYNAGKIEVIDYILDVTQRLPGDQAVLVGNILKYVSRYDLKNGVQDLHKAQQYLTWLIELLEEKQNATTTK